ncbi:MAG: ubiquinol-cytochrome c reductase iron-sulfur subunit [Thiohalobacterales bacterium]
MSGDEVDSGKRRFLVAATTLVGGVGVAFVAVPFISSMQPSAKARAAGAPVRVDFSRLEPGQKLTVEWRGKPVWIVNRTEAMLGTLKELNPILADPESTKSEQPEYITAEDRSVRPELLVMVGICTHLGCSPTFRPDVAPADLGRDWKGGFFCPCHGSKFDISGRVYASMPAPKNLPIPPYHFISETELIIGEDPKETA